MVRCTVVAAVAARPAVRRLRAPGGEAEEELADWGLSPPPPGRTGWVEVEAAEDSQAVVMARPEQVDRGS